jgi:hypothetical protein
MEQLTGNERFGLVLVIALAIAIAFVLTILIMFIIAFIRGYRERQEEIEE